MIRLSLSLRVEVLGVDGNSAMKKIELTWPALFSDDLEDGYEYPGV